MILAAEIPYWGETLIRIGIALAAVLLPAGTLVYLYLFKMMSFMQSRLGPMEAGPYGSLQLLAEVGKWIQKEDIFPSKADPAIADPRLRGRADPQPRQDRRGRQNARQSSPHAMPPVASRQV